MLNDIRQHTHGIAAKIIILLLVLSFAAWGIGDMLRTGAGHTNVANIGHEAITEPEFQRELSAETQSLRAQLGAKYSPELIRAVGLPGQVLNRMVNRKLIAMESRELGLLPSDAQVADFIRLSPYFKNGQGVFDRKLFQTYLRQSGISEKDYVEETRASMGVTLLVDAITKRAALPENEVLTMFSIKNEQRIADIYTLSPALVSAPAVPNPEQMEQFYQEKKNLFSIPEYRRLSYVTFTANGDDNERATANKLEDALAGGATLAEAAQTLNLNVNTLGPVDASGHLKDGKPVQDAEAAAIITAGFKLDAGAASSLTRGEKTSLIVQADEIIPESVRPLAEVKSQLLAVWEKAEREKALKSLSADIATRMQDKNSREATIRQYHLTVTATGKFGRGTPVKAGNISLPQALAEELFNLPMNGASAAHAGADGNYIIGIVKERITPAPLSKDAFEKNEEAKTLHSELEQQSKNELLQQYISYLRQKHSVSVDMTALDASEDTP